MCVYFARVAKFGKQKFTEKLKCPANTKSGKYKVKNPKSTNPAI